jgi:hypothetical protein
MALLVYAIAIPFFLIERTSLPLTVGILTGLMWLPFSGMIQHWVGLFHGIARTGLIVGGVVPFSRASVRDHTGGDCGHLSDYDLLAGQSTEIAQPNCALLTHLPVALSRGCT